MRRLLVRGVTTTVAVGTALGLAAGPVWAHECFNVERSAAAETVIAQHSHGWFDITTWQSYAILVVEPDSGVPAIPDGVQPLLDAEAAGTVDPELVVGAILGFAPAGALGPDLQDAFNALVAFAQLAAEDAACLGVPTHYLTLANATAGGGAERSGRPIDADGRGIDHFPDVYLTQLVAGYVAALSGTASDC
jgi:hypothetical protein